MRLFDSVAAAPIMKQSGGARIINFADWLPVSGRPRYRHFVPYYSSKAADIALTESLALQLAPEILVNAIAPGPILEPPGLTPEESMEVIKATPLRQWGGAGEIAKTVLFLVDSDFITGECIRVGGAGISIDAPPIKRRSSPGIGEFSLRSGRDLRGGGPRLRRTKPLRDRASGQAAITSRAIRVLTCRAIRRAPTRVLS
jgi:hypothetical protein